jgi:hypothetical protein
LKGINGRPPFAHDIYECRMKRISCPQTVAQKPTFFIGLLALGGGFRMGSPHAGHNFLVRPGNLGCRSMIRHASKQTALQDGENLIP